MCCTVMIVVIGMVPVYTVISSVMNGRAHHTLCLPRPITGQLGFMLPCMLTMYCLLMHCVLGMEVGEDCLRDVRLTYSFHSVRNWVNCVVVRQRTWWLCQTKQ